MFKKVREKGWRGIYGWGMKIWGCGYGILIGKIYGILNFVLLISTYFMVKGFEVSFIETIAVGFIAVAIIFIAGIVFVKIGLLKAEASSNFVENPQQVEMLESIRQIKKDLEELKNGTNRNL